MKAAKRTLPLSKTPAHQAYLQGDYSKAINLQMATVNDLVSSGEEPVTERKLLGLYLYSAGDYGSAIEILKVIEPLALDDSEIPENIGIMMRQSGNLSASVQYLLKAHKMAPEKANICDGLAHCYGNLGQDKECQHFGRLSLRIKDAEAAERAHVFEIGEAKPAPFSYDEPEANIIAFSLWGDNPRYLRGAIRNAQLAPDLYPGWTCRFYLDDSVPMAIVSELEALGAQIVRMPKPDPFYEGLLWRFRVIGDPTVNRYLVRDCDSVINIKERVAVDEWVASDKWFHMMRDFISHTEMILAGMFGGVNGEEGPFPPVAELREKFKTNTAPTRTYDQHFLREMVWPTMRQSVLIHDSAYPGELNSVPFPKVGQLGPRKHVGQNEAAIADFAEKADRVTRKTSGRQPFFLFGLKKSGTNFVQSLLNTHSEASCPSEHHLETIRDTLDQQISGYRRVVEDFDNKAAKQGVKIDDERLQDVLYRTWIEELMNVGVDAATTHIGLNDNDLAEKLPRHLELFPEAKFLFVVRDPRDVAVSIWHHRLRTEPKFAKSGITMDSIAPALAEKWTLQLEEVSKIARSHRGSIEMVRFEDLASEKRRGVTMRNVLKFLELNSSPEAIADIFEAVEDAPESKPWKDELTMDQIDEIQTICGKMMKAIRYDLFDTTPADLEEEADGIRNTEPTDRTKSKAADVALSA